MKAVVQERYGSPALLRVREQESPMVGRDEVLVRVEAASLHPDVWHAVRGWPFVLRLMGAGLLRPKKSIPGTDMSGVVDAVGEQTTRFRTGDEVFGETAGPNQWANGGAFAEYVSVREDRLATKPPNVSFEQAASVPTSGFIVLQNLPEANEIGPGRRVLINGAGGGVGALALQVIKAQGAHVTGVDRTSKLDLLRSLGADEVIDCTRENFTLDGPRYDFIFDIPGNHPFSACRRALKAEGKYTLIGHEKYGASGKRWFGLIPHFLRLMVQARFVGQLGSGRDRSSLPSQSESIGLLRELLQAGKVTPIVDSVYPLSQVHEAFRHLIEDELLGKVILTPRAVPTLRVGDQAESEH